MNINYRKFMKTWQKLEVNALGELIIIFDPKSGGNRFLTTFGHCILCERSLPPAESISLVCGKTVCETCRQTLG